MTEPTQHAKSWGICQTCRSSISVARHEAARMLPLGASVRVPVWMYRTNHGDYLAGYESGAVIKVTIPCIDCGGWSADVHLVRFEPTPMGALIEREPRVEPLTHWLFSEHAGKYRCDVR